MNFTSTGMTIAQIGSIDTGGGATDVKVVGTTAYVADQGDGFALVNISVYGKSSVI
ncbi:MAG: hypothetical protein JW779_16185 [Candidatus Thorarchaeota archaeon]|nr:hypothetical protein [Candidatus Thorarchaeota archaeon]